MGSSPSSLISSKESFMQFLKEIFEENKDEIKDWAGLAITFLCLAGVCWILDHVF